METGPGGDWRRAAWTKRRDWAVVGAALTATSIGMAMLPEAFDQPSLIHFRFMGARHGVSLLDILTLALLTTGAALVLGAFWQRRTEIARLIRESPLAVASGAFLAGLGLGVFLAATYTPFPQPGRLLSGMLFAAVLLAASVAAE